MREPHTYRLVIPSDPRTPFLTTMAEFFGPNTAVTIDFNVKWERLPAEPDAGFPLPAYEPMSAELLSVTLEILGTDGKLLRCLPIDVDEIPDNVMRELQQLCVEEPNYSRAADDYAAANPERDHAD